MPHLHYQSLDILNVLQESLQLDEHLTAPLCDLSVSFGFMHHVPLQKYREHVLTSLARQTRSGGFIIVSFWQFLNSAGMARRAQTTHERALHELELPSLEEGDYLLGWKNVPGAYRYCHSFSGAEIDQLAASLTRDVPASVISRFTSDGKTGNLNTYLILQKG
jgi:hypothetical protein